MRVLLVGNYAGSQQQSMLRFADLLAQLLSDAGHHVRLVVPQPWFGRLRSGDRGLGKWLGYLDRFVLFPFRLRWSVRWADAVHICDHSNAMYVSSVGRRPCSVTCHDVLAIRSALGKIPDINTRLTGRLLQRWILYGLRRVDWVVCVSQQTRSELQRVAGLPDERVSVVYNALNYPYRPIPKDEAWFWLNRLGLDDGAPYVLHVGGNQWYKNRIGVVRIFARLASMRAFSHHRLVLAGKHWSRELTDAVQSSGVAGRVLCLTDVSNEELRALYSLADFLLFPSLAEGFGWPIIEAQACGCPVVTTQRSPMKEVGGPASIYIDPQEPDIAVAVIATAIPQRQTLVADGFTNAMRFSREAMRSGYVSVLSSLMTDR